MSTHRFAIYENPENSAVTDEFDTLAEALKFRALPAAQIIRNGTVYANAYTGGRWWPTADGVSELMGPQKPQPKAAERVITIEVNLEDLDDSDSPFRDTFLNRVAFEIVARRFRVASERYEVTIRRVG
jgi:hypothetical protein